MNAENTPVPAPDFTSLPLPKTATGDSTVDNLKFAPFMLIDGRPASLVLFDFHFELKARVFKAHARQGWSGNGRDWEAVAQVIIAEQLSATTGKFNFDSDATLFSVSGEKADVMKLGSALKTVFDDEYVLRDILFRARLPA
jgi:Immunity protein 51